MLFAPAFSTTTKRWPSYFTAKYPEAPVSVTTDSRASPALNGARDTRRGCTQAPMEKASGLKASHALATRTAPLGPPV
eukprot:3127289-Pyramimonas_sp.AAC.1